MNLKYCDEYLFQVPSPWNIRCDLSLCRNASPYIITAWEVSIFGVFLVRIFPDSDWIHRDTSYLSVFSPNAGKSGPEKLRIWTRFTQWIAENMNAISPLPSISLLLLISIYLFIVCRPLFHKVRYILNIKYPIPNLWTTPAFYPVSFWRR